MEAKNIQHSIIIEHLNYSVSLTVPPPPSGSGLIEFLYIYLCINGGLLSIECSSQNPIHLHDDYIP